MAIMIKTFGWIIAYAPDSVLLFFIKIISGLFFIFPSRQSTYLNLIFDMPSLIGPTLRLKKYRGSRLLEQ